MEHTGEDILSCPTGKAVQLKLRHEGHLNTATRRRGPDPVTTTMKEISVHTKSLPHIISFKSPGKESLRLRGAVICSCPLGGLAPDLESLDAGPEPQH